MKNKIRNFMVGRYGDDALNRFICILIFIFIVLNWILQNNIIRIVIYVFFFLFIYRSFSKNIVARSIENDKFIKHKRKVSRIFKIMKKNFQDKENKYVLCPTCVQMIRVPKGKGKIEITCRHCKKRFEKRS